MTPPSALRVLLTGLVDHAGLFPPAALTMREAVAEYATHRGGPHAWMLGRFVCPVARLAEFADAAGPRIDPAAPWRLAALAGDGIAADLAVVAAFDATHRGATIDVVEVKASTADAVAAIARAARGVPVAVYVEVPVAEDPTPLVEAIGAAGLRAKIRTGGVTADAFPTPPRVARFLGACVRAKVPFKATAGLHHPLRGEYRLTYAPDAPHGTMFGFLNVFLAAALLRDGGTEADAVALLEERDPGAITADDRRVAWRGRTLLTARLAQLRDAAAVSFGSCSFAEPVADLTALGFL